jgi:hypothetical protein
MIPELTVVGISISLVSAAVLIQLQRADRSEPDHDDQHQQGA